MGTGHRGGVWGTREGQGAHRWGVGRTGRSGATWEGQGHTEEGCGHSQLQPPGLQLRLVLLHHAVAVEVAGPAQALHDLQEADLAENKACQHRRPGEGMPWPPVSSLRGCPEAPPGARPERR